MMPPDVGLGSVYVVAFAGKLTKWMTLAEPPGPFRSEMKIAWESCNDELGAQLNVGLAPLPVRLKPRINSGVVAVPTAGVFTITVVGTLLGLATVKVHAPVRAGS